MLSLIPRVQEPAAVLCDCLGVVKGMHRIQAGQPVNHLDHQDFWQRIKDAYAKMKNPETLITQKSKRTPLRLSLIHI